MTDEPFWHQVWSSYNQPTVHWWSLVTESIGNLYMWKVPGIVKKRSKKGTKWLTTNESLDEMSIWEIFVGYDILPATNIGSENRPGLKRKFHCPTIPFPIYNLGLFHPSYPCFSAIYREDTPKKSSPIQHHPTSLPVQAPMRGGECRSEAKKTGWKPAFNGWIYLLENQHGHGNSTISRCISY